MSERVSILVSLDGSDEGLKGAIMSAEQSLNGMGTAGKAAGSQAAEGLNRIAPAAKDAGKAFDDLGKTAFAFNNIKTAVEDLVHALGGTPLEVLKTADAYNGLAARIKMVTGEGDAFKTAFEGVQKVAIATRSDLEATGTLFARIAAAGKEMGISQQQALGLTQTINQAIQVTGGSAASSEAAITQLIQGLQSGVLRGEEFNSVMEQAPRLAQAMADGLGVSTGELRKMAQEGQLSTTTVIRALQSQSKTVQDEFAKIPPSVGGALTNLGTSWKVYVGEVDKANGVTTAVANAINKLGTNIGPVVDFLQSMGKAVAAVMALKLYEYLSSVGAQAQTAAASLSAKAAATANATAATAKDTKATAELTAVIDLNNAATKATVTTHVVATDALLTHAAATKAAALGYGNLNSALATHVPAMQAAPKAIENTNKATDTLRIGMSGSANAINDVSTNVKQASAAMGGMDKNVTDVTPKISKAASETTGLGKASDGLKTSMGLGAQIADAFGKGLGSIGTVATGAFTLAGNAAKGMMAIVGGLPGIALMILANYKEIGTWIGEFVAKHTSAGAKLAENEQKLAAQEEELRKKAEERAQAEAKLNAESDKAIRNYAKQAEEAAKRIPLAEKEVKATEDHAKAIMTLVQQTGNENLVLQANVEQSSLVALAKEKAAQAHQTETDAIAAQIEALKEQIALQGGPITKAQQEELKRLGETLAAKKSDADASNAQAEAARAAADAASLHAEKSKDNSAKLGEYTATVKEAQKQVDFYTQLQQTGANVASELKDATSGLTTSEALRRDALSDLISQIENKARIESAELQTIAAQASARQKHLELLAKEAAANGDLVKAQELETQAKQESIKALQAKYEATKTEIDAELKSIALKKDHVSGTDDEKRAQLAALAAQEQMTKARQSDNEAIKDQIKGIKDEISQLNGLEGAFKTLGVTSDKELRATADKSFEAFQKIASSGQASAREVRDAFKKFAEDAIKANDGVADEFIKSQASAHGLTIEVDSTGKAIVKAMDSGSQSIKGATGYMDAFKQSALAATAALEAQNAELERQISAQEKANELKERALELERKRKNVDKDGFVLDNNGNRLQISVPTRAGVFEQAKSRGLSEAQALQIADRFIGEDGKQTGWQGTGKTWSVALNEAIEKLILDNARNTANGNGWELGSANNTRNGTLDSGNSTSHSVTVNMGGNKRVIETKTANDASTLTGILEQLGKDSRRAA